MKDHKHDALYGNIIVSSHTFYFVITITINDQRQAMVQIPETERNFDKQTLPTLKSNALSRGALGGCEGVGAGTVHKVR